MVNEEKCHTFRLLRRFRRVAFPILRKGVTGHMEKLVKVAVDAMGGDHAPGEVVKGAVDAVNEKTI